VALSLSRLALPTFSYPFPLLRCLLGFSVAAYFRLPSLNLWYKYTAFT